MNLSQARKKLDEISKSTGTKHVKVLVSELCKVLHSVLSAIERIEKSMHPLQTITFPKQNPVPPTETGLPTTNPIDPPFTPRPFRSPPIKDPFDARQLEGDSE
ncbi:hypothetical protein LCGC14_0141290 [marine sediment metagenome]|uniref:Uncharacterized protein n=1 Tax=marine sediment metagenome TaxID=412755 RepID=A0A0F9Y2L8_9ZZZZ